MKYLKKISLVCAALSIGLSMHSVSQTLESAVRHALQFADRQLRASVAELGVDSVRIPRRTRPDGSWETLPPRAWTSGFFPGCLWYMFEHTKDPLYESAARRWTEALSELQFYGGSHDVGFMVFNSYGNGHRLRPSDDYKSVILQTARTLAGRFNPAVGCIRSWDHGKWQFPVIIDNMMNLELLLWSAENGGDSSLKSIAVTHAVNTMNKHFRSDGGTYHVIEYDPANGEILARKTHQGYSDESTWSRGQAWAIYGFTMTYRFTKDRRFLETAQRAADYFISRLPDDSVPYWDFQAPNIPNEERDASAGAIASSALFELSRLTLDSDRQKMYRETAEKILGSLCSPAYLAESTSSRGILLHAVGSRPAGSEVDVSLIYSDYYFLEAALRYFGM